MNKTLTINISGIVFNIEEDAYETLKNYLGKIKSHFRNDEGCEEIVADIESRMAEILKARMNAGKQVLVMADIQDAIGVMGQPEDFSDNPASEENKKEEAQGHTQQSYYGNKRRRVFRDPDNNILGGVCSGIGNYFDVDPLWIRLALVVMFFGFGSGFLLYIILWIIIPEAKTTAEKLEMRGEPVDINTISKTIRDEAENLKGKAKDFGNNVRDKVGKDSTNKFVDLLRQVFGGIFNVLGRLLGGLLVFFGIVVFVGLLSVLFGFGKIDNITTGEFVNSFAGPDFPIFWAKTALSLAVGIPLLMFVYKGMKMLLGIKYHNYWLNMGAGIAWVIGLCLSFYIVVKFANEFSEDAALKQQTEVRTLSNDTLYLKASTNYNESGQDIDFSVDRDRWFINKQEKSSIWWGKPKVRIIASETDSLDVFIIKSASGNEKTEAAKRAKNISYSLQQQDSLILIDKYYSFPGTDKFRKQEAEVLIKVPRNKVIYLDPSLKKLLYDVDNTDEIFDEEMVGIYWKMTDNGLTCLNCPERLKRQIHRSEGLHIEDKDAKVKINENGIEVKSKDAHVKIDENGININSKDEKDEE